MKTFRRDKLRRLVEAGRVETVSTYHYDDTYGETRTREPMPVAMAPLDWRDRVDGVCYLTPHDFTSGSGCCYSRLEDDKVTLIVHSNSSYDLRILP